MFPGACGPEEHSVWARCLPGRSLSAPGSTSLCLSMRSSTDSFGPQKAFVGSILNMVSMDEGWYPQLATLVSTHPRRRPTPGALSQAERTRLSGSRDLSTGGAQPCVPHSSGFWRRKWPRALERHPLSAPRHAEIIATALPRGIWKRTWDTLPTSLPVPRTRRDYQTQVVERSHRRREAVESAMGERFVKGVSQAQVGQVMETLTGSHSSTSTVSRVFPTLEAEDEPWQGRELSGRSVSAFADGTSFTVIYHRVGCTMPILAIVAWGFAPWANGKCSAFALGTGRSSRRGKTCRRISKTEA